MRKSVAGSVADPTLKFAKLKLGGEEYSLCYSFNAIAEAERVAGCNLLIALEGLQNLSAIQLRGLLYAALTKAHPDISIERAGALIGIKSLGPITTALASAYSLSMEDPANPPEAESAAAKS